MLAHELLDGLDWNGDTIRATRIENSTDSAPHQSAATKTSAARLRACGPGGGTWVNQGTGGVSPGDAFS